MAIGSPFAGIEIHAYALTVLARSFDAFPRIAKAYAIKHGVAREDEHGELAVVGEWFPVDAWIAMLDAITSEVGPTAMFRGGVLIMKHPNLPPFTRDVEGALRSIDVAFHLSHRKGGRVMYDRATGEMLEGIGHYAVSGSAAARRLVVTCDSPYPCPFDLGIVTELSKRFEPRAVVAHDRPETCRVKGGARCAYVVAW